MPPAAKPWKSLKTHKGPATQVPQLLSRLDDAASDIRELGKRALSMVLIAEGKWCSATPRVLAELVDRALAVDHLERAWCLRLATNLLTAGHHGWLTTGLAPDSARVKQLMTRGAAASARKAAAAELPRVVTLLADPDDSVAAGAAFFLGFVPSEQAARALHDAYALQPTRHAALLPALAMQLRYAGDAAAFPSTPPAAKETVGLFWACRLLVEQVEFDTTIEQSFVDALTQAHNDEASFPWAYGRPDKLVLRVLLDHSVEGRQLATRVLALAIEQAPSHPCVHEWAATWVELTFEPSIRPLEASTLTDRQREHLKQFTCLNLRWEGALQRAGIPTNTETRRRWLGMDPMGAIGEGPAQSGLCVSGNAASVEDFIRAKVADGAAEPELVAAFEAAGKGVDWILEVLADMACGVFGTPLRVPTPGFLAEYLRQHPAEATTWAPALVASYSERLPNGGDEVARDALRWLLTQGLPAPSTSDHLCLGFGDGARVLLESLPPARRDAMLLRALDGANLEHTSRQVASHANLLSAPVRARLTAVAEALAQGDRAEQAAAERVRSALAT